MHLNKLNEQQLKMLSELKGSDIHTLLLDELFAVDRQLMTCSDDVLTRWLQGRKQALFEITEIITSARDYLNTKSKRKEIRNAF